MIKKISFILIMTLFVFTTSCKKGGESTVNKTNGTVISPNDPNAVIPKVGGANVTNDPVKPPPPADGKYPEITFVTKVHNFGQITQGDKVMYDFKFKNTGKANLLISDAKGSCGCTVPEYPKEAIKPGESNKIKVSFDSSNKHGENSKVVTLVCNTMEGKEVLTIKAIINIPKGATKK